MSRGEEAINTHGLRMPNGIHKGELITRVPVSYLKWMVNAGHQWAAQARAELDRRGTSTPKVDVSGHAIDRASLRCQTIWNETRRPDEGLNSWLIRLSEEALKTKPDSQGRYHHLGLRFVFEQDGVWPVLKTVMPKSPRETCRECGARKKLFDDGEFGFDCVCGDPWEDPEMLGIL